MSQSQIKSIVDAIYTARKTRRTHPEGRTDNAGRWYPGDREDAGVSSRIRSPSRAWPWSYMLACRTRKHVAQLVEIALRGGDVPADVARAIGAAQPQQLAA